MNGTSGAIPGSEQNWQNQSEEIKSEVIHKIELLTFRRREV